jgi:dTDP-glucose 4,6-dehydratase
MMNGSKLRALGWEPLVDFDKGLEATVRWNMDHADHWQHDLVGVV